MRLLAVIVMIIGLASVVLGVIFIFQANAGNQEIIDQIAPLEISQVEDRYDQVDATVEQLKVAEGAALQAGNPSNSYLYVSAQRTSLGLTKSNIGNVKAARMNGIVDIVLGVGLVLAGWGIYKKSAA
ncbi:MAG: hypothetical protein A2Z29_04795 [Chloroflexi bacterium RBG_16_56_11]|nr:MAG: hypothetical protein A2Z29_04795 [Chloroflexi bacterium RBG_16_56_11]